MKKMIKCGIAIDDWKLEIFEKHLTEAGYTFVKAAGLAPNVSILSVETGTPIELQKLLTVANSECAKMKMH